MQVLPPPLPYCLRGEVQVFSRFSITEFYGPLLVPEIFGILLSSDFSDDDADDVADDDDELTDTS